MYSFKSYVPLARFHYQFETLKFPFYFQFSLLILLKLIAPDFLWAASFSSVSASFLLLASWAFFLRC